MSHVQ